MRYELALSPELGVSLSGFVQTWNASDERQDLSSAREATSPDDIFDPEQYAGGIVLLGDVAPTVARGELYRHIEAVLAERGVGQDVTMTPIHQPDGSYFLSITLADDEE